jgi:glycosyltransferase involved in cell wall biosynthesis
MSLPSPTRPGPAPVVVPVADAPVLVAGSGYAPGARVAVCIPVHQGRRHLEATLRSVLDQTLAELEVVVLDNASTDGTAELLASFDDPRLSVWRSPVTVPMTENFRRAVARSHAPLVKILPADDLLEPDCLASQVAALDSDPGLALVVGRKHLVDEHGTVLARSRFVRRLAGPRTRAAVVRRVVRSGANPIGTDAAGMFRRDRYVAAGGYGDVPALGDLELWLRLLQHGRFLGQTATVARFRVGGHAASAADHRADYRTQQAFTAAIAAADRGVVRRRDVVAGRLRAPLARRRRVLLYRAACVTARLGAWSGSTTRTTGGAR